MTEYPSDPSRREALLNLGLTEEPAGMWLDGRAGAILDRVVLHGMTADPPEWLDPFKACQRIFTYLPIPAHAPDGWDWRQVDLTHHIGRSAVLAVKLGGVAITASAGYRIAELRPVDDGRRLMVVVER